MKKHTTSGTIVMTDSLGIKYKICKIDYTVFEDESYEYVFTPYYRIIDILPNEFQGIPGLDLSLRKKTYMRKNMHPVFVTERSFGDDRVDKWELLEEVGMTYNNRLEWMIRANKKYIGDNLSVIRYSDDVKDVIIPMDKYGFDEFCKTALTEIGNGNNVIVGDTNIEGKAVCEILRMGVKSKHDSNERGNGPGRKTVVIDDASLMKAKEMISAGLATSDELSKELGISRATLFRRLKTLDTKN